MKRFAILKACLLLTIIAIDASSVGYAQLKNCTFGPPLVNIDFGAGSSPNMSLSFLRYYRQMNIPCPNDGEYSFIPALGEGCFNNNWLNLREDHTAGDFGGKMMVVNASNNPSTFFEVKLNGLAAGKNFELSAWFVNVCIGSNGCTPHPPNIVITISSTTGKTLAKFTTGEIAINSSGKWSRYAALFSTPAEGGNLILSMYNSSEGGCGNDFAMDDIVIRECILPVPAEKKPPVVKPVVPVSNPVVKAAPPVAKPVIKPAAVPAKPVVSTPVKENPPPQKSDPKLSTTPVKKEPVATTTVIQKTASLPVIPKILETRANPVVRKIETETAEMTIDLYDNGEIDGDTVTVYHNNELLVSRAGLSAKPVSFKIKVDAQHPHHELIMVANNLGSIPPNTSLMIVTANGKRHEVFISSSEEKNAKVVIDWNADR